MGQYPSISRKSDSGSFVHVVKLGGAERNEGRNLRDGAEPERETVRGQLTYSVPTYSMNYVEDVRRRRN